MDALVKLVVIFPVMFQCSCACAVRVCCFWQQGKCDIWEYFEIKDKDEQCKIQVQCLSTCIKAQGGQEETENRKSRLTYSASPVSTRCRAETITLLIARMVISIYAPIEFCGRRSLSHSAYKTASRGTITTRVVERIYEDGIAEHKMDFQHFNKVAVTTCSWTAITTESCHLLFHSQAGFENHCPSD